MLNNQLYQGGTRALIDYEETLFDNFVLPDGMDDSDGSVRESVIDDILFRHGDAPLAFPDPEIMKFYIGRWAKRSGPLWLRYYNAVTAEYNPLENYDRQETRTETREDAMGNTRTLNTENTVNGEVNESGTDTTENSVSAENVNTFEPDDKSVRTPALKTENDVTTTDTGTIKDSGSYDGSLAASSRIHGNIGVTTSQQMLRAELDLVPMLDIIKYISDSYFAEFCIGVY